MYRHPAVNCLEHQHGVPARADVGVGAAAAAAVVPYTLHCHPGLCVTPGVLPPLLALVLVHLVVHLLLLHTQDANQPPMGPLRNPADPHRL